jgi:hypothetical protein
MRTAEPAAEQVASLTLRAITSGRRARPAGLLLAGIAGPSTNPKRSTYTAPTGSVDCHTSGDKRSRQREVCRRLGIEGKSSRRPHYLGASSPPRAT